jgi:hypothetical protein
MRWFILNVSVLNAIIENPINTNRVITSCITLSCNSENGPPFPLNPMRFAGT